MREKILQLIQQEKNTKNTLLLLECLKTAYKIKKTEDNGSKKYPISWWSDF